MAEIEGLLRHNADEVHLQVTEGMVREFVLRDGWGFNGLRWVKHWNSNLLLIDIIKSCSLVSVRVRDFLTHHNLVVSAVSA